MKKLLVLVMAVLSSQVGCAQKTDNKTEISIQNSNSIVIQQLEKFKTQDHFAGDGQLYTGVQEPALAISLNRKVADTAQAFIALYQQKNEPTKAELLHVLAHGISQIDPDTLDTEDREQVATTFESFLDIVGLESSEGILNKWVYGEEIGKLLEQDKH
ncbi:DUF4844 domain-containing protein [Acinetobacter baumannii]|uniref:DUF4844 domain-containing protein n=1 Tax=Acinetobacter baumannii TaxID=470 RepID=UPI0010FDE1F7|nr:DUF4844 domain-containing protein [Acinetobacter baumannii]MDC4012244.1 DUF4844 domain-containing protein [Acinetobacter baumannii]MDC4109572.1 DUF4844 domain-containing protein [Acinetobacter baumannii]MDC4325738.1 DUF4844 domain-containing protein [Acinetobacter baumannii]MDK1591956.1 DUF4844 domain-containing protein [Acinetobacter baumannii]MDO7427220.1 DUF4844 domain-containing protein [Acinetobacter baumannii]